MRANEIGASNMAGAHVAGRIGWIGAGSIGLPMLARLTAAGYSLVVFDRDPERLRLVRGSGAEIAPSPAAVARASEAVFLCLPDAIAITDVMFGAAGCVAGGMTGKLLVDTSSIDPILTRELAARLAHEANGRWIDAPVSGGVRGAADGTLVAFLGGSHEDVTAAHVWIA